jgi:hypothetical protein
MPGYPLIAGGAFLVFASIFGILTFGVGALLVGILGLPFYIWNLVDAYNTAKRYNLCLLQSIGGEA